MWSLQFDGSAPVIFFQKCSAFQEKLLLSDIMKIRVSLKTWEKKILFHFRDEIYRDFEGDFRNDLLELAVPFWIFVVQGRKN